MEGWTLEKSLTLGLMITFDLTVIFAVVVIIGLHFMASLDTKYELERWRRWKKHTQITQGVFLVSSLSLALFTLLHIITAHA